MKTIIISYILKIILKTFFLFIRNDGIIIPEKPEKLIKQGGGFILAGWHNQILILLNHVSVYCQKKRKLKVTPLVSMSTDGNLIYQTFLRFNMKSVRGSTSRGGAAGMKALLKTLKENRVPIFTPDGPRGPLYKLQQGCIQIAAMTGLPLVAFNSTFDRYYEARSWDVHRFPKFLAKQRIGYSEPFHVPKGTKDLDEYNVQFERIMLEQVRELDAFYNKITITESPKKYRTQQE